MNVVYAQRRNASKFYIAVVWGEVLNQHLDVQVDIGKDSHPDWENVRMVVGSDPFCVKPKQSRTKVGTWELTEEGRISDRLIVQMKVLERGLYRNQPATKLLLSPITGRRHQVSQQFCKNLSSDWDYSYEFTVITSDIRLSETSHTAIGKTF